ncbi:hydroxymethylglutaryl-CoA reductase, degradative, partial [bacterium]|nr:hydroxymethylglutaryl-CoA reductase, degradative [bacterium]
MTENLTDKFKEYLNGFSKLNRKERYDRLVELGALKKEDVKCLSGSEPVDIGLAEKFIENVIGYYQLPMGVATHFVINKKPYVIPMAVEETSIIAAASKTAKWVRDHGEMTFSVEGDLVIGQLQISKVKNIEKLRSVIKENKEDFIEELNNEVAYGLVRRGGGVKELTLREISRPDGLTMAVVHVYVNACEAMGANIVNQ